MSQQIVDKLVQELNPLRFHIRTTISKALDMDGLLSEVAGQTKWRENFTVLTEAINDRQPDAFLEYLQSLFFSIEEDVVRKNRHVNAFIAFLKVYNSKFQYLPNPLYPDPCLEPMEVLTREGSDNVRIIDQSFEYYIELAELKQKGYDSMVAVEIHRYLVAIHNLIEMLFARIEHPPLTVPVKSLRRQEKTPQSFRVTKEVYTKKNADLADLRDALIKKGFIESVGTTVFKRMFSPDDVQPPEGKIIWKGTANALAYFLRGLKQVLNLGPRFPVYIVASKWFTLHDQLDYDFSDLKDSTKPPEVETKQSLDKALQLLS